jgi:hypothetical protein
VAGTQTRLTIERRDVGMVFSCQARVLKTSVELLAESVRQRLAFQRSFSRVQALRPVKDAPYALLLEIFETAYAAELLRTQMSGLGFDAQVGRWEDANGPIYEVYLTGFASLPSVGGAALALHGNGFRPQIVVLPSVPALAGASQSAFSSGYPLGP